MKSDAWHARNPGGQRDKSSDHGKQPSDENRQISPAREEAVSPIELAVSHENPAAIALDKRAAAVASDLVGNEGSKVTTEGSGGRDPQEFEGALEDEISGEGHYEFGRERDAGGLDRHKKANARIARNGDYFADEDEDNSEKFFSHRNQCSVHGTQYSVKPLG